MKHFVVTARYAVYFAPAAHLPLWQAGCRWLGRDPETDRVLVQPEVPGFLSARISEVTASPRSYGLHATFKAPFNLRDDASAGDLVAALDRFAARQAGFSIPGIQVAGLGGFLALQPSTECAALADLAAACVTRFDGFRRPPDAEETAKRRAAGLSARQQTLLEQWGYPYVLDQYRFHITLTERLEHADRVLLQPWLQRYFAEALREPLRCESICLFVQGHRAAAFRLVQRFTFGGAASSGNVP